MFQVYSNNFSTIVETFPFGLNGLNDEENALIIELTIEHITTTESS